MAEKTIYDSPTITDTVIIPILTPDVNDCLFANPYMVNNLTIYYIERDFSRGNLTPYEVVQANAAAQQAAAAAQAVACQSPSAHNITVAHQLLTKANSMNVSQTVYYNDAIPVMVVGNSNFPAWLSTDLGNAFLVNNPIDDNGNSIYGNFEYIWTPLGMREGNYIACWTWTPLSGGQTLSTNLSFSLAGNTAVTTSIPTHFTPPEKYEVLLDRYMPEMYKDKLTDLDLTPDVLTKFNAAVGQGFTTIEDLANQVIDLQDSNATSEAFLGLLSRLFGLDLRSDDPTRWRRQIRRAIPLYKKKGTIRGLQEACELAGMKLNRVVRYWQIISPYTWVDAFKLTAVAGTSFPLSKVALTIDPTNFKVSVRKAGYTEYDIISNDDISIDTPDEQSCGISLGVCTLTVSNDVVLGEGDILKVLYQYAPINNPTQQDIEDYIQLLPLADNRDETSQDYPLKNWNVRIIEEDDPLFSILIPVRNPYHDFLVFGKVRTEFPFSENVYNMDEYNGCCTFVTLVTTENGVRKLGEIGTDKFILTERGLRPFAGLVSQGQRSTFVVKFKSGRQITQTDNHQLRVLMPDGTLTWKRTNQLAISDYVLGKRGTISTASIPEDKWYLAGFAYGDGCLHKDTIYWLVPAGEEESKTRIIDMVSALGEKCNVQELTAKKHQPYTHLKCNKSIWRLSKSRNLLPSLAAIMPNYQPKGVWKADLPKTIWTTTSANQCLFLTGLFDTDGGVQKGDPVLTTKWHTLATQVQTLLLHLGILSTVTEYKVKYKNNLRTYYRVRVTGELSVAKFTTMIGFKLSRKQKALLGGYISTNVWCAKSKTFCSDRTIIPFADKIIRRIFPQKKRMSKLAVKDRSKIEQQTLCLITRLKQSQLKVLPDNRVSAVLEKALEYGIHGEHLDLLKNYVEHGWFFDKVISIEAGEAQEVFDPLNVEETRSYISNGLVSHNSIRDSLDPCDIDKDFLDPCGQCIGSKFMIDIQIDDLSDARIMEAKDIVQDFVPFHAVPHAINFNGSVNDFVQPPVETIQCLIYYKGQETVISGEAQMVFNRGMIDNNRALTQVFRNALATKSSVASGTGTAYNNRIMLFSPDTPIDRLGMSNVPAETVLEIYGPHPNAGRYQLANAVNHAAEVYVPISPTAALTEPVNQTGFSYSLSNIAYSNTNTAIAADNIITLLDTWNLAELGVQTQWSVDHSYAAQAWTIKLPTYSATSYIIQNIMPDGSVLLAQNGTLPTTGVTGIAYSILGPNNTVAQTGTLDISVQKRGLVTVADMILTDIRTKAKVGGEYFMYYSGTEYPIIGIVEDKTLQFYISGWAGGSVGGKTIEIHQRLIDTRYGLLTYDGISIRTPVDYETGLLISNGVNPVAVPLEDSRFKENFLIVINDGAGDTFALAEIDHNTITLSGDMHYWKTFGSGGSSVTYEIFRYVTGAVTVDGVSFPRLDRRGSEIILSDEEDTTPMTMNMAGGPEIEDIVRQEEKISYRIEFKNGTVQEGSVC